jgi:hypothetical protein
MGSGRSLRRFWLAFGGVVVGLRQTIGWFWMGYFGSHGRVLRGVIYRKNLANGRVFTDSFGAGRWQVFGKWYLKP